MKFDILNRYDSIMHLVTEKDATKEYGLSMAMHTGEDKSKIFLNRQTLERYYGKNKYFCSILQIHSSDIYIVDLADDIGWNTLNEDIKADALITNLPDTVLTILTADCVPILIYDPSNHAIGAVHAGWKGTHANILEKCLLKMQEEYKTSPSEVIIAIGPSIGGCCYEIEDNVAKYFTNFNKAIVKTSEIKFQLDLKSVIQAQLLKLGVKTENIEKSSICTSCDNDRFFSYRKEQGCSGRFMSTIMLKELSLVYP